MATHAEISTDLEPRLLQQPQSSYLQPPELSLQCRSSSYEQAPTPFRRHTAHSEKPYLQQTQDHATPKHIRPASYCQSVDSALYQQRQRQSSQLPSLTEVLANTAPPPYTLSAFMAFLSQNHCLETLEFVLDASRYRQTYLAAAANSNGVPEVNDSERLIVLWKRLVDAYIRPCAPREVNLPAHVRDPLIRMPLHFAAPTPDSLDQAVALTIELMRDSVLAPFLASLKHASPRMQSQAQRNSGRFSVDSNRSSVSSHRLSLPASTGTKFSPTTSSGSRFSMTSPTSGQLPGSTTPCSDHSPVGWSESGDSDMEEVAIPMTPPSTPPNAEQGPKWGKKMREKLRWKRNSVER
ncbi:hypothetical protein NEOLI_001362 [Neolecta irregularis DAH-3]|uniref:RGS domain-containing protein n=1 Tax=Neolecta irregularis (strain DAH-3) TaxID=1198029 RepID=A0A1U7LHK4_NEOID|nr:hypothetical protein NEOLI_001362 [Neolecta irregularis DAH-3]|eukprot:OLL22108.1 hypothetical protein NEOLI_001362 [Neolecta irregularis DAH-3]